MAAVLVVAAYIAAQMLSDIMSLKIAYVAAFSVDAGTFIYPFTFTLRDLVHKLLGKRHARLIVVTAGVINLVMAGGLGPGRLAAARSDLAAAGGLRSRAGAGVAHRDRQHRRRGGWPS